MRGTWLPQSRAERLIAVTRLILAVAALVAVWVDPQQPSRNRAFTYTLVVSYAVYSLVLALWNATATTYHRYSRYVTHGIDLIVFMVVNFLTIGPSSPFFVFYVFSLVCATLRFGMIATAVTAIVAIVMFVGSGIASIGLTDEFGVTRFIIRSTYLAVVAALLIYLSTYRLRLFTEMRKIATWSRSGSPTREGLLSDLLEQSCQVTGAQRILLAYEYRGEAVLLYGQVEPAGFQFFELPEHDAKRLLEDLGDQSLVSRDARRDARPLRRLIMAGSRSTLPRELVEKFDVRSLMSTSFESEFVRGRVVFLDCEDILEEDLALAKIVAGIIGSRLDHFNAMDHVQRGTLAQERVRLGRNLHDSLLQSLTGVALQLRTLPKLMLRDPDAAAERVAEMQKVIASDQRDLRSFIDQLRTDVPPGHQESLYDVQLRLQELKERFHQQWDLNVDYKLDSAVQLLPDSLRLEVYSIISEAVANAAKHAEAKNVRVSVALSPLSVDLTVVDDGRGFPFTGTYTLDELFASRRGPVTLKERIASLRGEMVIDSTAGGSVLTIRIPTTA